MNKESSETALVYKQPIINKEQQMIFMNISLYKLVYFPFISEDMVKKMKRCQ